MNNMQIDVTGEGRDGILHALAIIWPSAAPGGNAVHYKSMRLTEETKYYCRDEDGGHRTHHFTRLTEDPGGTPTLVLLWHEESNSIALPYPLNLEQSARFIADWLDHADYGRQPDHDGDNGRGWRLFTESWGHVCGHHYAIVGAMPAWAMYCK